MTRARNSATYPPEMLEMLLTIGLSQGSITLQYDNVRDALDQRNRFYGLRTALGKEHYCELDTCLAVRFRIDGSNLIVEGAHSFVKSSLNRAMETAIKELREQPIAAKVSPTNDNYQNTTARDGITAMGEHNSVPAPPADAIAAFMGRTLSAQRVGCSPAELPDTSTASESADDALLAAVAVAPQGQVAVAMLPEHLQLLFAPKPASDADVPETPDSK